MKTVSLREANQQFSKLAREIEESGETVLVLRNGKPAIKLGPAEEEARKLSRAQEEAIAFLRDPKNHFTSPPGWRFDKEALYDQAVLRHRAVRRLWGVPELKPAAKKKARKRAAPHHD